MVRKMTNISIKNEKIMSDNRDVYLDYIKAFGIGLVVMGHTEVFPSEVTTVIFAFHMPIFFFCSGCLFKGYRKGQVGKYFKRYLLRYVFYAILFSMSFQLLKFGNLDILKEAKSLALGKYDV